MTTCFGSSDGDHTDVWRLTAFIVGYLVVVPLALVTIKTTKHILTNVEQKELQAIRERQSLQLRAQVFLYVETSLGLYWEMLQSVCAFLSCLAYIASTYDDDCTLAGSATFEVVVEVTLGCIFALDYALNLWLADDPVMHVTLRESNSHSSDPRGCACVCRLPNIPRGSEG